MTKGMVHLAPGKSIESISRYSLRGERWLDSVTASIVLYYVLMKFWMQVLILMVRNNLWMFLKIFIMIQIYLLFHIAKTFLTKLLIESWKSSKGETSAK